MVLDHYSFYIQLILLLCQNSNEKTTCDSLDLLQNAIGFLTSRISGLRTQAIIVNEEKSSNIFASNTNSNNFSTIESLSEILNSIFKKLKKYFSHTGSWLSIFKLLTSLFLKDSKTIKNKANETFFSLLREKNLEFSKETWEKVISEVLTPFVSTLFFVQHDTRFLIEILKNLNELICENFGNLRVLFEKIVDLMNENGEKHFLKYFLHLVLNVVQNNGKMFTQELWPKIIYSLSAIYENTIRTQLVQFGYKEIDFSELNNIQLMNIISSYSKITFEIEEFSVNQTIMHYSVKIVHSILEFCFENLSYEVNLPISLY